MQILWQVPKAEELFSDGHSTQCFSLPHTLDVSVRNDKPTSSVQRLFIARLWNLGGGVCIRDKKGSAMVEERDRLCC